MSDWTEDAHGYTVLRPAHRPIVMLDAGVVGVALIAALVIHTDAGVRKVEKAIGRGLVHVVTLGHK